MSASENSPNTNSIVLNLNFEMKLSYDDAFFSKYTPSEKAEVWDRLVAAADKFGGKIEMVGYECFEETAAREGLLRELKANYTKKEGEDEEDEEETSE